MSNCVTTEPDSDTREATSPDAAEALTCVYGLVGRLRSLLHTEEVTLHVLSVPPASTELM